MKVTARLNNYRRSPQKVRESGKLIIGMAVGDALVQLDHLVKGDSKKLKVLLESAIANAQNNHKLDKENLYVSNIVVNEGRTLKRWRPRAYGRAAQILKRTCHVTMELGEIEEGKRPQKQQQEKAVEKPKKADEKAVDKKDKADSGSQKDKQDSKEQEHDLSPDRPPAEDFSKRDKGQLKGGGGKKVFRRKSF